MNVILSERKLHVKLVSPFDFTMNIFHTHEYLVSHQNPELK